MIKLSLNLLLFSHFCFALAQNEEQIKTLKPEKIYNYFTCPGDFPSKMKFDGEIYPVYAKSKGARCSTGYEDSFVLKVGHLEGDYDVQEYFIASTYPKEPNRLIMRRLSNFTTKTPSLNRARGGTTLRHCNYLFRTESFAYRLMGFVYKVLGTNEVKLVEIGYRDREQCEFRPYLQENELRFFYQSSMDNNPEKTDRLLILEGLIPG